MPGDTPLVTETDICIVGGGIMGTATAYSISKRSSSAVLVIDRYGVGNEYCSSNDVNRVFRYSYGGDEYYTKMAVKSLEHWKELEKEAGQELLITTGLLMLRGTSEQANRFNEASYHTLSRMGLGAERLGAAELKKRFSQFKADEGILDPHGGVLLASKSLSGLTQLSRSRGVRFLKNQVQRVSTGQTILVETIDGQTLRCRKLVITAGAWSNQLLRKGLTRITPLRQQLVYFRPREGVDKFRPKSCPVFFTDEHYGLPAAGIDGIKVSPKELWEEVNPETAKRTVDAEEVESCRDVCQRFVPSLAHGEVVHSKVCLYDMTDNSDFVLDLDPDNPNIAYGYGFSGHGFKFAPLIGSILADLALDSKPSFDIERFAAVPSRRKATTFRGQLGQGE